MPITIVTGPPGSGKTLWTMQTVEKLREESGRPVYYYNIPDVTLPWNKLEDPKLVHELPQGSIVVCDEAWQPYPNRPAGSPKPPYIEPFATHRHRGHDFFLMSQSAGQLDQFIRGMVGRHVHLERKFGLPRSRVWSWESRLGSPGDYMSRTEATASEFIFPKRFYGAYKSADLHTVKQRVPWFRLAAIGGGMLLAVGLFIVVIGRFSHKKHEQQGSTSTSSAASATGAGALQGARTAREFDQAFQEVAPGEPYSPVFYRGKLAPATLPKITGFLVMTRGTETICKALTQQGTVITSISQQRCLYLWRYGWFDFTRTKEDDEADAKAASGPRPGDLDVHLVETSSAVPPQQQAAPPTQGGAAPGAGAPPPVR